MTPRRVLRRFAREETGAALVEFAFILPVMLLMFAVAVEGGRTYHSYQTTISGVRDAARYLSRVMRSDACITGAEVGDWNQTLKQIVSTDKKQSDLFSPGVSVQSVTSTLNCVAGDWRGEGAAPIATVTATLVISYPLSGLFSFAGGSLATVTTTVSDTARIIGS